MFFFFFTDRVHGVYHAFTKIIAVGGLRGLWAGWVPNVQRAALVNLGGTVVKTSSNLLATVLLQCQLFFNFILLLDLMTYDTVKHFLLRNTSIPDNSICHGLAR